MVCVEKMDLIFSFAKTFFKAIALCCPASFSGTSLLIFAAAVAFSA
jgi:hypothetical protein